MITTKDIYYQENFQVGAFLFKTYGTTKEFTEESEKQQAWDEAKKDVLEQFKKDNPHLEPSVLQIEQTEQIAIQLMQSPINVVDSTINEIYKCNSIDELKAFKILATTDKSIQAAYNLQQLKLKK